jgi:hypothetical protein
LKCQEVKPDPRISGELDEFDDLCGGLLPIAVTIIGGFGIIGAGAEFFGSRQKPVFFQGQIIFYDCVHTAHGNGKSPVFDPLNPAFFPKIPDVELQIFFRNSQQLFHLKDPDPGVPGIAPAGSVEH